MISILIPFQTDRGPRQKAFEWIKQFYAHNMKGTEICVGSCKTKPFSKAQAVNNAASNAKGEVFIILDADMICSPSILRQSVQLLDKYPWIIPYSTVKNISKSSTKQLMNASPAWPLPSNIQTKINYFGKALPVGGINVLPKKCFFNIGGFDERFVGWGGEDDAFACAVNTLCGRYKRLKTSVYHLWHPKSPVRHNPYYAKNTALAHRYCNSSNDKHAIKQIINERFHF
ncbi:Glycosyl transferase family 2 [Alteribacillus persepolensis]|uniref:Glycosyl transferase family 2 n=1 Tax=Alteribacillus persepolensis TaxID=568899 RepID=A0A1G8IQ67_9BACI|nr:galactosyltransferase-related protein [Alteribacillus persepolensis]SDI21096.1 Glycosyl transferase family 2 [Alteribacillus persepolensis]